MSTAASQQEKYAPPFSDTARYTVEHRPAMVAAMKEAGVNPALISTFEETGFYICRGWWNRMSTEEQEEASKALDKALPPFESSLVQSSILELLADQFAGSAPFALGMERRMDIVACMGSLAMALSADVMSESQARKFWMTVMEVILGTKKEDESTDNVEADDYVASAEEVAHVSEAASQ